MKEMMNLIEKTMSSTQKCSHVDQHFQLTMLAIATILVALMEWMY